MDGPLFALSGGPALRTFLTLYALLLTDQEVRHAKQQ